MTAPHASTAGSTMRVGDAEREHTAAELGRHMASGRLDLAEYENRLDLAYAARTGADLQQVLSDLPARETVPAARPAPRRMPAAAWGPWALTAVICLVVWISTSLAQGAPTYFWPGWVIGPWGAVLVARTLTSR